MQTGNPEPMAPSPREEYRSSLRFPLSLEAHVHYSADKEAEPCRIVDVSSRGLGIELDRPVRMLGGQLVLLTIDVAPKEPPVSAISKLAWTVRDRSRQRAGSVLMFIEPEAKQRLLDQAYAGLVSGVSRNSNA